VLQNPLKHNCYVQMITSVAIVSLIIQNDAESEDSGMNCIFSDRLFR
jgi:hypothetical protein